MKMSAAFVAARRPVPDLLLRRMVDYECAKKKNRKTHYSSFCSNANVALFDSASNGSVKPEYLDA